MARFLHRLPVLVLLLSSCFACAQPWRAAAGIAATHQLSVGGATIQVDFANGAMDLTPDQILEHIRKAANAITTYYGRFPVTRARILVVPAQDGRREAISGTTWGDVDGVPAFTRLRVAEHATQTDLDRDWVTTHELDHFAFPSLPDENHWMEEGLASYVEPIARVMTGELKERGIWADMVRGMPQGEPAAGDQGLDHTHTWGRTYWGGALFCLVADVEIRRQTGNHKGLQDALRAIVEQGGTIDHDWPLERALEAGDKATGTHVLTEMYAKWKDAPVRVDLPKLWEQLGVRATNDGVELLPNAKLADAREAITRKSNY
jgi:hypothetical protein